MVLHLLTPSTTTVVKIVLNDIRDACSTVDIFNGCSSGPQVWSTCGPEFGNFPHLIPFFLKASLLPNVGGNRSLLNSMSRIVLFLCQFYGIPFWHVPMCEPWCVNPDYTGISRWRSISEAEANIYTLLYTYCIYIVYIRYCNIEANGIPGAGLPHTSSIILGADVALPVILLLRSIIAQQWQVLL